MPTDQLLLGLNGTWVRAETSEDFVVTSPVPKGTQLPNTPEFKFNIFGQYDWPVNFVNDGSIYARLQYTWQDESRSQLETFGEDSGTPTRIQPAYGIADFKLGLVSDRWELQGFVNNIGDERAVIYNNVFFFDTFWGRDRVTTNRPREYGVRFRYNWGD